MLAGRKLVDLDEAFEIERSLPHGHVAAVLGVLRDLDLERLICRAALPGARPGRRDGGATADRAGIEALGDPPFRADDARLRARVWARSRRPSCWPRWTGCSRARSGSRGRSRKRHLERGGVHALRPLLELRRGALLPVGLAWLLPRRGAGQGAGQLRADLLARGPAGRDLGSRGPNPRPADAARRCRFGARALRDRGGRRGRRPRHAHPGARRRADRGRGRLRQRPASPPQIRKLVAAGDLQLSLFDETNLAEISSAEFPGERLVVCRNPALAAERARKREDLLHATEAELEKVTSDGRRAARVASQRRRPARSASAPGASSTSYKVAKHFAARDRRRRLLLRAARHEQIDAEAALDGLYVIRTTCPTAKLDSAGRGRARLQTAEDGRAGLPHDERPDRDPPHLPPPRRPRPRPRLPLHARLLRRLRAAHRDWHHSSSPTPSRSHQQTPSPPHSAPPPPRPRPAARRRRTATPPTASPT